MRGRWTRQASAMAAWGSLGLALAVNGCEFLVTDALPDFTCVPGAAGVCPAGATCDPTTHRCARPGLVTVGNDGAVLDATANRDGRPNDASVSGDRDAWSAAEAEAGGVVHVNLPDARSTDSEAAPSDTGSCSGIACKCSGVADCPNGFCAQELTVTHAIFVAAGSVSFCSQPCCTSADCPAPSVCFASGQGGNDCVMPGWLQRAASPGKSLGGAACQANGDCRSGLCAANTCADTCCSAGNSGAECAAGSTCRIGTFPGAGFDTHATALCGATNTCTSGFQCDRPCRNMRDCGPGMACYDQAATLPSKDIVAACTQSNGTGAEGNHCTSDFQCASNFCDSVTMACSDVCFANSDCVVDGWHCRPANVQVQSGGSYSVLTCGP